MVVTSHTIATEVALDVLKKGGNAIDAAVTAGFALAVTQPRSGNIGGGGFMLISSEQQQEVISIDYREKAPAAATRDMFLDKTGAVDPQLSRFPAVLPVSPVPSPGLSQLWKSMAPSPWPKLWPPPLNWPKRALW